MPSPSAIHVDLEPPAPPRFAFALALLARVPMPVLHALARCLAFVAMHVVRYRRDVVDGNLALAFPALPVAARVRIARDFYRNLADVVVETAKGAVIDGSELAARVRITNPELLDRFAAARQSIIMLGGHEANWEWIFLACSHRLPFAVDAVCKPLHNRAVDAFMARTRTRFGARLVPPDKALRELAQRRDTLRAIALLVDQRPAPGNESRWTTFLGQDTSFLTGFEKLARLWQYPVVYTARRRVGRGRYEVTFELLGEPPYEPGSFVLVERYAQALEASIRRQPAAWLWSHHRWRDRKPLYA